MNLGSSSGNIDKGDKEVKREEKKKNEEEQKKKELKKR